MTDQKKRQPAGVPIGGEFAANEHDEAGLTLSADDPTGIVNRMTFVERGEDLFVLEDGQEIAATADEVKDYEFAISTLHEDDDAVATYRRMNALALHLGVDMSEVEDSEESPESYYGLPMYECNGERWIIGDDEQATAAARLYAREHLWATNADTIANATEIDADAIRAIQDSMYENANEPLTKIIDATGDLDSFVDEIIEDDGRGNGLSGWDGQEQRIQTQLGDQITEFYMYRWD